jgi:osmotically-inducible protein OsmY
MMKNDSQLKSDIIDELGWDPSVDATEVGVIVKDGIVTLTGHVGSYAEKIAVEHATQRVKGVMGVAQEIRSGFHQSIKERMRISLRLLAIHLIGTH